MKKLKMIFFISNLFIILGFGYPVFARPAPHQLIDLEGQVKFKRRGEENDKPARIGINLYDGDLLHLAPNARAIVQCRNGSEWRIPSSTIAGVRNGCRPSRSGHSSSSGNEICNNRTCHR